MRSQVEFSMLGAKIESVEGMESGSEDVSITTDRGRLVLRHSQDCCETVYLEDVVGDPTDLVGATIASFTEDTKDGADEHGSHVEMWTFYNLVTDKGDVTLRWYGSSNGYYSISVHSDWVSPLPKLRDSADPILASISFFDEDGWAWRWLDIDREARRRGDPSKEKVIQFSPQGLRDLFSKYSLN